MGPLAQTIAGILLVAVTAVSCGSPAADQPGVISLGEALRDPDGAGCDPGSLVSLESCAPEPGGNCHLCAVISSQEGAVCRQPCMLGAGTCPSGQTCHPIDELLGAGGYGRLGDCPSGYCR
jgi:hypothetical protein